MYLSKGLEFDAVFIYDASAANYHSEADQRLLLHLLYPSSAPPLSAVGRPAESVAKGLRVFDGMADHDF